VAEDGEQGLEMFRQLLPDIVLTDIMMPKMSGLEMSRAIRLQSPDAQIVCMTAFSDTGYLIDAIDIGINQFVLKPVEFLRLFTALDRCQEMVELRKRQIVLEAENLRTKKIEAIGILAGGMAHDFNNLLQIILGYTSLARMKAEPGSKTEALLAIAEESSESARELSSRLLMFAKGGDMFKIPTRLTQLIRESLETELDSSPAVILLQDLPDTLPLAKVDVDQLRQVIANLVSNACEAMPEGGTLQVSASATALTETNNFGLLPGEYLHVYFKDSGTGIKPENLPNIFDPYFSTKEMGCQKGMGLGLALCHSIIKHHNGHIFAESTPGVGTCLHIYLPVSQTN
jgi:signal transduction histidine kinase